jgi:hypothetical protein
VNVNERRQDRDTVLWECFKAVDGKARESFWEKDIQATLGWDEERFQPVIRWLLDHGWIKFVAFGGLDEMTVPGIDFIEEALSKTPPSSPSPDVDPPGYL